MKRRYTAAAAMMMVMGLCASASAAYDENLDDYTLDTMVVEADAVKNKFGDTITEQSYYRTGGDVKVITRQEIEKRHISKIPAIVVMVNMVGCLAKMVFPSMAIRVLYFWLTAVV